MKKLYNVTVEYEAVVLAEDEGEARDVALSATFDVDPDVMVAPMNHMPGGWDGEVIPFGDPDDEEHEDRTLDEWIEAGAAPEYVRIQAALARARTGDTSTEGGGK